MMPDMTTADNDTAAQLARIQARAEGMGLTAFISGDENAEDKRLMIGSLDAATAESLLGVLDPDAPVIEIGGDHCCVFTATSCPFHDHGYAEDSNPPVPAGPDHEWVMVCRRKVKVDG